MSQQKRGEDLGLVPSSHTRQLTMVYSSGSRGSDTLFIYGVHMYVY